MNVGGAVLELVVELDPAVSVKDVRWRRAESSKLQCLLALATRVTEALADEEVGELAVLAAAQLCREEKRQLCLRYPPSSTQA